MLKITVFCLAGLTLLLQAARAKMEPEHFRYFLEVRKILGYQKFHILEAIYREFGKREQPKNAQGGTRAPGEP